MMRRHFGLPPDLSDNGVDLRMPRPIIILLCGFALAVVLFGVFIA